MNQQIWCTQLKSSTSRVFSWTSLANVLLYNSVKDCSSSNLNWMVLLWNIFLSYRTAGIFVCVLLQPVCGDLRQFDLSSWTSWCVSETCFVWDDFFLQSCHAMQFSSFATLLGSSSSIPDARRTQPDKHCSSCLRHSSWLNCKFHLRRV